MVIVTSVSKLGFITVIDPCKLVEKSPINSVFLKKNVTRYGHYHFRQQVHPFAERKDRYHVKISGVCVCVYIVLPLVPGVAVTTQMLN